MGPGASWPAPASFALFDLLVAAAATRVARSGPALRENVAQPPPRALEIVDERLAVGEISEREHEQAGGTLRPRRGTRP